MNRAEILAMVKKRFTVVEIPGLGTVNLRKLPASYLSVVGRIVKTDNPDQKEKDLAVKMWRVALCWVDDDGERVFSDDQVGGVLELDSDAFNAVLAEIDHLSPIPSVEQAEKNSETISGS